MPVTPYWEIHIRPMFRQIDHDHMTSYFDLFDYDAVVQNQSDIVDALTTSSMPPKSTGGPWPDEWIALFQRWVAANYPRLGSTTGVAYTLVKKSNMVVLTAQGTIGTNDTAWFERLPDNTRPVYQLVVRPGTPGASKAFKVEEKSVPAGTTSVSARDGDGEHIVNV